MISFITSDTQERIPVCSVCGFEIEELYVVTSLGLRGREKHYKGYGRFGNTSIFTQIALCNQRKTAQDGEKIWRLIPEGQGGEYLTKEGINFQRYMPIKNLYIKIFIYFQR